MPTYRIVTLGCKLNQADSAALEEGLRALGLARAAGPSDLVVLNTCTVTGGADREARQIARRLRRQNPRATLIATGCFAEREPGGLGRLEEVDHVVGMRDQAATVVRLAAASLGLDRDPPPALASAGCAAGAGPAERTRALLKVQDGCDLRCSYCVIPSVRGRSRSVPPVEVLRRLESLIGAGHLEIVFTGVNTGDYGADLDPPQRLHHLLRRVAAAPGLGRVRLNSLEPRTVTPEIIEILSDGSSRVAPHLQVPLQSGSDRVLARMRRPYRAADYLRVVESLRRSAPEIGLGADVIVGFPGETAGEFEETVRLIAASPLNYLHVFSYSPRPGTPAASLPDPVPPAIIRERSARLRALGRERSLRFRRSFEGRTLEALTLREVRPDGRLRALTGNFIDLGIDLDGRHAGPLMNRLLEVRVTAATDDDTLAEVAS